MGKQEFEFPSDNEKMQIGGWIRTSRTWKKHGEKHLWKTAWRPSKPEQTFLKPMAKWLTLFLAANRKQSHDKN